VRIDSMNVEVRQRRPHQEPSHQDERDGVAEPYLPSHSATKYSYRVSTRLGPPRFPCSGANAGGNYCDLFALLTLLRSPAGLRRISEEAPSA
jgi:hypothetical protein